MYAHEYNEITQVIYTKEQGDEAIVKKYSISELNKRIIPASYIIETYPPKIEKELIYKNTTTHLEEKYVKAHYERIKKYYKKNNANELFFKELETKEEIWRLHPYGELEVSNFGRVRLGDEIIEQIETEYYEEGEYKGYGKGYLKLSKYGYKCCYVWNLVAETWLVRPSGNCIYDVHHITNDGYDNRPENLIYLSRDEHSKINHRTRE